MAGTLTVQNIQGPASGANANKVIIPAGQTLELTEGVALPSGTTLPAGVGGKVLQVVGTSTDTSTTTSSTSFVDTAITASITPSSTSSKILAICSIPVKSQTGSSVGADAQYILLTRNGTGINLTVSGTREANGFFDYVQSGSSITYLDSPSSTSLLTYKIQIRSNHTSCTIIAPTNSGDGTITLVEIAG